MKLYYYSSMSFLRTLLMFVFVFLIMGFYESYADELFCEQTNCKFYGNHLWSDKPCFKNKYKTLNLDKINHKSKKNLVSWNDRYNYTNCATEYCPDSSSNSSYSLNLNNKLLSIKTYGNYGGGYGHYSMEQKFVCKELPKEKILMYSKKDLKTSADKINSDISSKVDLVHFNEIREVTLQIDSKFYSTLVALHITPSWKKNLMQFQGRIILFNEICNLYGSYQKKIKEGKININCRLLNYKIFTKIDIYNLILVSGKGEDTSSSFVKLLLKLENSKNLNQNDFLMAIQDKKNFYNPNKFSNQISNKKEKAKRLEEERKRKALEQRIAELEKKNKELQQPKKQQKAQPKSGSGSGFFISKLGHIITNQHVVNKCSRITVGDSIDKQVPAELLETDKRNDLALLKTTSLKLASAETKSLIQKLSIEIVPLATAGLMRGNDVKLGEDVLVAGFPYGDIFSKNIKVTKGIVSSTTGIKDDSGQFQLDAAVQPGNSGGPIYDKYGNIVGVVVAQLNKFKMAKAIGSLPENVNFGIKASTVKQFLNESIPTRWSERTKEISTTKLSEIAKKQTVMVVCHR